MHADFIFEFYKSSIAGKRDLLKQILTENDIQFYEHSFTSGFGNGKNFIITPKMKSESSILVSAHYDGIGIYDNCGGALQMLDLVLSERKKKETSSVTYIFTDLEECYQQGIYQYTLSSFFTRPIFHLNIDGIGVGENLIVMPYDKFCANKVYHDKTLVTDNRIISELGIPSFQSFSLDSKDFTIDKEEIRYNESIENYLYEYWVVSKSIIYNRNLFYTEKYIKCIDDILKNNLKMNQWIY